jgi:hypothetical protein
VRTISILSQRNLLGWLVTVLIMATILAGCGNKETGEAQTAPPPSLMVLPSLRVIVQPTVQPTSQPTVQPKPTLFVIGPLFDPSLDIMAGPIDLPLELQIRSLAVYAPVLGVGLTPEYMMDAPKGPVDDPVWQKAFWYRGSSIPGDVGTATIAGHVNDPKGRPQIFAHLADLKPGDVIIIHVNNTHIDMYFIVDQVKIYSIEESSDPAVLTQIFGAGPISGTGPQPALDGLSHLTLITCAGNFANDQFDHHIVVYATRSK